MGKLVESPNVVPIREMLSGMVPVSVLNLEVVPKRWEAIDREMMLHWKQSNLQSRQVDHYFPDGISFSKFSYGLCEYVIKYWSRRGDTILDPFMGWGTRCACSVGLGRRYIGYEVAPSMFKRSSKFVSDISGRLLRIAATSEMKTASLDDITKNNGHAARPRSAIPSDIPYQLVLGDGVSLSPRYDRTIFPKISMILTCPPYWNVEEYESVSGQLSDIGDYGDFMDRLGQGLALQYRLLAPGGFAIYVVGDFRYEGQLKLMHKDTLEQGISVGFEPWDVLISIVGSPFLHLGAKRTANQRYTCKVHDYVIVFRKPPG
jgi:DNA modification methylase